MDPIRAYCFVGCAHYTAYWTAQCKNKYLQATSITSHHIMTQKHDHYYYMI